MIILLFTHTQSSLVFYRVYWQMFTLHRIWTSFHCVLYNSFYKVEVSRVFIYHWQTAKEREQNLKWIIYDWMCPYETYLSRVLSEQTCVLLLCLIVDQVADAKSCDEKWKLSSIWTFIHYLDNYGWQGKEIQWRYDEWCSVCRLWWLQQKPSVREAIVWR